MGVQLGLCGLPFLMWPSLDRSPSVTLYRSRAVLCRVGGWVDVGRGASRGGSQQSRRASARQPAPRLLPSRRPRLADEALLLPALVAQHHAKRAVPLGVEGQAGAAAAAAAALVRRRLIRPAAARRRRRHVAAWRGLAAWRRLRSLARAAAVTLLPGGRRGRHGHASRGRLNFRLSQEAALHPRGDQGQGAGIQLSEGGRFGATQSQGERAAPLLRGPRGRRNAHCL